MCNKNIAEAKNIPENWVYLVNVLNGTFSIEDIKQRLP